MLLFCCRNTQSIFLHSLGFCFGHIHRSASRSILWNVCVLIQVRASVRAPFLSGQGARSIFFYKQIWTLTRISFTTWPLKQGIMKKYAERFYTSRAWEECRKAYTKSVGGICERCMKAGVITPAEIVHHKIHITPDNINDPSITLDWNNLECVCRKCHAELHGKAKRFKVDAFGHVTIL